MTWTYDGNPAGSEKDQVRFLCGDTDPNMPLLQDEEIQFLLDQEGNPQAAAIAACENIIAHLAKQVDYTIGPESVKASQALDNYLKLYKRLKDSVAGKYAAPLWDCHSDYPLFRIGMHDNWRC